MTNQCCCGKYKPLDEPFVMNDTMHEPYGEPGAFCGSVINHTLRYYEKELERVRAQLIAAEARIAEKEWISVDERLPEERVANVLTFGGAGFNCPIIRQFSLDDDDRVRWDSMYADTHYLLKEEPVTHWMPLPDPPECPLPRGEAEKD